MAEAIWRVKWSSNRAAAAVSSLGRITFALAIVALGIETLVCARYVGNSLGYRHNIVPALPWLPAIPWIAYPFGAIWVACGVGLLSRRLRRTAAIALGGLLFLCALLLDLPPYAVDLGSIGLRTTAFESLALASLAWLLPGPGAIPASLTRGSRYLLAVCLIVFGADHFPILAFIGSLQPAWIPWHAFWAAFFGLALIAAGLGIGLNILQRWAAAGIGLMFGIWVVTLHLPRVLGLYAIPGAPSNPNEWSSLFIATALWGGLWALARVQAP